MSRVLITGGDGYLGLGLAKKLLAEGKSVDLWMRKASEEAFAEKKSKVLEEVGNNYGDALRFFGGDLTTDSAFAEVPPDEIESIFHSAAVIRFNVEEELAEAANLNGARRLFEFAKKCSNLKQMNYVSTVYSSGQTRGAIEEKPFSSSIEFTNFYEKSKNQAENLLLEEYSSLPWNILRVATVIADDDSGTVHQFNAVHNTLRLLYNGLISLVPGQADTPVYLVTRDFVVAGMSAVHKAGSTNKIYHLCHQKEESATVQELLNLVYEGFSAEEGFQSKRVLKPLLVPQAEFDNLAKNMLAFSSPIIGDALGSITPFAGQLYITKEFQNSELRSIMGDDYSAPDVRTLIPEVTKYLVKSKWGREDV